MDPMKFELMIMAISMALDTAMRLVAQIQSGTVTLSVEQLESMIAARRGEIELLKAEIDHLGSGIVIHPMGGES